MLYVLLPKFPPQFSYTSFPGSAGQRCLKERSWLRRIKKETPCTISTLLKVLQQNQIRVNAGGSNVSIHFETEVWNSYSNSLKSPTSLQASISWLVSPFSPNISLVQGCRHFNAEEFKLLLSWQQRAAYSFFLTVKNVSSFPLVQVWQMEQGCSEGDHWSVNFAS